ncbi:MAG: hypothetical protein AAGB97_08305 [Dehalococcoidia bacterium]|nr:hypothetical protein [Chloroflexota bacterium]
MACELLKVHCKKLKLGGVPRVYDQINFQDREQYLTAVLSGSKCAGRTGSRNC